MGTSSSAPAVDSRTIFDFDVPCATNAAEPFSLSTLRGKKAYLLVNVASCWGFTSVNYSEFNTLLERHSSDLEIIAFPCNNFGSQEPGTNEEIASFAKGKGFKGTLTGKIECENYDSTHPLFQYLKANTSGGLLGQGIKWNFSKFLVNGEGRPVQRYLPTTGPLACENDIKTVIQTGKL